MVNPILAVQYFEPKPRQQCEQANLVHNRTLYFRSGHTGTTSTQMLRGITYILNPSRSATLAFSLFATPAAAQKNRSNKGGTQRGDARVPDNDKNSGKHKGETKGKHNAKGHRH